MKKIYSLCFVLAFSQVLNAQMAPPPFTLFAKTETGLCIPSTVFEINGTSNGIPVFTDPPSIVFDDQTCGFTYTNFNVSDGALVEAVNESDPLNGVNTFDLFLIRQHILGGTQLGSPYKMIAADANKNGMITSFDIVEFRKLILGVYLELPNNDSWRYAPADFVFTDPTNPFGNVIPGPVPFNTILSMGSAEFTGVKIGDVNNDVDPQLQAEPDERGPAFAWSLNDEWVAAGTEVTLELSPEVAAKALQFTLQGDGVEWLSVAGLDQQEYAIHPDALTVSWFGDQVPSVKITVKTNKSGRLSDLIQITDAVTPSVAFQENGAAYGVEIKFRQPSPAAFTVFQNAPNPANGSTQIEYFLPESGEVKLTVFDVTGRVVVEQQILATAGYQQFTLDNLTKFPAGTTLYYRVTANGTSVVRAMQIH
jgi:hypothetical protein